MHQQLYLFVRFDFILSSSSSVKVNEFTEFTVFEGKSSSERKEYRNPLLVKEESFLKIERSKQTKKLLLIRTTLLVINLTLLLLTFIQDDLITRLILPLCRESDKEEKEKD